MNTFSVVYRTGGTHDCRWVRVPRAFTSVSAANDEANALLRMGYKALYRDTHELDVIGIPVGWDHGLVDWEKDEIVYSRYETRHIKHSA